MRRKLGVILLVLALVLGGTTIAAPAASAIADVPETASSLRIRIPKPRPPKPRPPIWKPDRPTLPPSRPLPPRPRPLPPRPVELPPVLIGIEDVCAGVITCTRGNLVTLGDVPTYEYKFRRGWTKAEIDFTIERTRAKRCVLRVVLGGAAGEIFLRTDDYGAKASVSTRFGYLVATGSRGACAQTVRSLTS